MRRERPVLAQVIRAFVLVLLAGLVLTGCMEWSHRRQERDRMGYIASGIGAEMYEFLLSEMSKTRVLEAYLIQTDGDYSDFGRVAHERSLCAGRDRGRCLSSGGERGRHRAEHV